MTYQKQIAVLPEDKVAPFVRIYQQVYAVIGNERGAAKALNVSRSTVEKLCDKNYLTDKQARRILAAYLQMKHHLPKAGLNGD